MKQLTTLDNGLRIITTEMNDNAIISMWAMIGTGAAHEPEDLAGVSHFLEHMPFRGTKNFPSTREVSQSIESVGGYLNAENENESTSYWCKIPAPYADTGFHVVTDLIINPILNAEHADLERKIIKDEIRLNDQHSSSLCMRLINKAIWNDQPAGREVGGDEESIDRNHHLGHTGIPSLPLHPKQYGHLRRRSDQARLRSPHHGKTHPEMANRANPGRNPPHGTALSNRPYRSDTARPTRPP